MIYLLRECILQCHMCLQCLKNFQRVTLPHVKKISSVQSLSRVQLFVTSWTAARQASLFITNSKSLLKLMSLQSVMPSNHLILCHPLLLLPSSFPSIRVFSSESVLHIRQPKYWSFSLFRTDFLQEVLVGSPCSPKDSQESFPTPQFRSINSSALSFLQSPTLTSTHNYWKNHFFDQIYIYWQSKPSAFYFYFF